MRAIAHRVGAAAVALFLAACADNPAAPDVIEGRFERLPASGGIDFESFNLGNINGQNGWSKTGGFDVAVVANSGAPASFGTQSLRISNAVTGGSFGDQTFSQRLTDEAGETSAYEAAPSGTRQARFETEFEFSSTSPTEQVGLAVTISPDNGSGARLSFLRISDKPAGLQVEFADYRDLAPFGSPASTIDGRSGSDAFLTSLIASGLSRTTGHRLRLSIDFVPGPRNDIVKVWIDGALVHTGTTWEDYYRWVQCNGCPESNSPAGVYESRVARALLFRVSGTAAPTLAGGGLLLDNFSLESSSPVPPAVTNTALTVRPNTPGLLDAGDNIVGSLGDAAPGFTVGSFGSGGLTKSDMYFPAELLFPGRALTVGEIASMSYWTKKGPTHVSVDVDWYLALYTKPYAGDKSTPSWYGDRYGAEPYYSVGINAPVNTWNKWNTAGGTNQLRFFESTQGAPGANFGSYTDPDWASFRSSFALSGMPRASQEILYISLQTGSAWAAGFTGKLDGLTITLTDGSTATVNFEADEDNIAPVVTNVAVSQNPAPVGTAITLTASASDNDAVVSAAYIINDGVEVAIPFTAGASVNLSSSLGAPSVGVYTICVIARDISGNTSNEECTQLAVYDPTAGFVTGGGKVLSPAGADKKNGNETLTGPASFGFVSKYQKGKTTPDGNLQFQFQAGDLNFKGTSMEWLVVQGGDKRAQFRGEGLLNGTTSCKYTVSASDSGLDGKDSFGITISCGGSDRYVLPETTLDQGNVQIHAK